MELIIIIVIAVIILLVLLFSGYVKAPTNRAFIISGFRREPKVVIGRSSIKLPFLERLDKLSLSLVQVDVKTEDSVPTKDFINIMVDGVANVQIDSSTEGLRKAAENFLNAGSEYIAQVAKQVLEGNLREIIGQMELIELVQNRETFANQVADSTASELSKMGLRVVNLTIQNFVDENGVIKDLGIENTSRIQKNAAIAKANAEKEITIAKARAAREANEEEVASQKQIAIKQNELAINIAKLKVDSDMEKAKAEASFSIEQQAQRKTIEIASVNADIARKEREAEAKEREILIRERELDAKIRKEADAERYRREQQAQADLFERQKQAEAILFESQKRAEAMKAEAEGILAKGNAEAEAMEKKALAQNKMQEAAILESLIGVLPELARAVATPLNNVQSITMYGEGNQTKLIGDTINSLSQITKGVKEATGINLSEIFNNFAGTSMALKANTNPETVSVNVSVEEPKQDQSEETSTVSEATPIQVEKKAEPFAKPEAPETTTDNN